MAFIHLIRLHRTQPNDYGILQCKWGASPFGGLFGLQANIWHMSFLVKIRIKLLTCRRVYMILSHLTSPSTSPPTEQRNLGKNLHRRTKSLLSVHICKNWPTLKTTAPRKLLSNNTPMVHSERFLGGACFYHQLGSFQRILSIQDSSSAPRQEESTIWHAECGLCEDRGHWQSLKGSMELSGQHGIEASEGCEAQALPCRFPSWGSFPEIPSPSLWSAKSR